MLVKASAPGSLMLLGEYGVLYGKPALVCAVDKRIHVTITPREDHHIHLHRQGHASYQATISNLLTSASYAYVIAALKLHQSRLRQGCDVVIESEFSDKIGLGSSAAVTVATLAALMAWLGIHVSPLELIRQGRKIVRLVQGVGSGADIAASVQGGVVAYRVQPLIAEKFSNQYPLTVHYAGYKTPTKEAINVVQEKFTSQTNILRSIASAIGHCAEAGIQALRDNKWAEIGKLMVIQQGLMESLGVSNRLLRGMVDGMLQQPAILGAKISGSGLGDCVVGLGDYQAQTKQEVVPVNMTLQGVYCEKI